MIVDALLDADVHIGFAYCSRGDGQQPYSGLNCRAEGVTSYPDVRMYGLDRALGLGVPLFPEPVRDRRDVEVALEAMANTFSARTKRRSVTDHVRVLQPEEPRTESSSSCSNTAPSPEQPRPAAARLAARPSTGGARGGGPSNLYGGGGGTSFGGLIG